MFWYRDAALIWHLWLNRLISTRDDSFRPHVDDAVHAIIKSQHTTNLAGNVLTGGLAEGIYDRQIQKVLSADARVGSPGGGTLSLAVACIGLIQPRRFGALARYDAFEVC